MDWLEPAEWSAWRRRVAAERAAHNLTPGRRDALLALLTCLSTGTQPTDAEVARLACCCVRTVQRAREDGRRLGLLSWQGTRQLVAGAWRRGPNAYAVHMPAAPVCPTGQGVRARKEGRKKEAWEGGKPPTLFPQPAALAALAEVRKRREGLLAGQCGQRSGTG